MKKNIALIIPSLTNGGAERVVSNLSIHLTDEKYNKYVIVYDDSKRDYPVGCEVINMNLVAKGGFFSKLITFFKRIIKLRKIKKERNIDVSISFLESPNLINIFSRVKDKVFVSIRNFKSKQVDSFYGKIYKFMIKNFYNKADKIIVVSKLIKEDLIKNFDIKSDKIKVIYNSYDVEKIQKMANEELEDEYKEIFNVPTIINVGRLNNQKGQWHLIRAFSEVKKEIKDANLVILGQGELEEYLKELVNDYGLNGSVRFLGFQKNPFKFIAKSSLFVFPSLFEGFPNALAEAMACGVPVISSDCPSGPREILAPETEITKKSTEVEYAEYGVLVPVCDGGKRKAEELVTKEENLLKGEMIKLIKDENINKNYRKKSIRRVKDFEIKHIIKDWDVLIG